jgi:hypothetical protein
VLSGKQHLQQFLRLRIAAQVFGRDEGERTDTRALHAQLECGDSLEIAGYTVSPALAAGLAQAQLAPPRPGNRAVWLDVVPGADSQPSVAGTARVDAWRAAGWSVHPTLVVGAPFWQTQEISEGTELVAATTAALKDVA